MYFLEWMIDSISLYIYNIYIHIYFYMNLYDGRHGPRAAACVWRSAAGSRSRDPWVSPEKGQVVYLNGSFQNPVCFFITIHDLLHYLIRGSQLLGRVWFEDETTNSFSNLWLARPGRKRDDWRLDIPIGIGSPETICK